LQENSAYATAYRNAPVEIYAELSKKQFKDLCSGEIVMQLPSGSSFRHREGSRAVSISCADREIADMIESGLDLSGVSWQEI
jgi:hypothetical protein